MVVLWLRNETGRKPFSHKAGSRGVPVGGGQRHEVPGFSAVYLVAIIVT